MNDLLVSHITEQEELNDLYELRKEIYTKWGYLEESSSLRDIDEYDLENRSVHFAANYNNHVVGTIRLIMGDKVEGLPIEKEFSLDFDIKKIPRAQMVEVSRMASNNHIEKHFSDQRIMFALIKIIHDYSLREGKLFWFAAIDKGMYKRFSDLGIGWTKIGKEKMYLGSVTIPALLNLSDAMLKLKLQNNKVWEKITIGQPGVKVII